MARSQNLWPEENMGTPEGLNSLTMKSPVSIFGSEL